MKNDFLGKNIKEVIKMSFTVQCMHDIISLKATSAYMHKYGISDTPGRVGETATITYYEGVFHNDENFSK